MHSKSKQSSEKQSETYRPLILIVDDNLDNLLLAKSVIECLEMRCVVTDDSEKCLNLINQLLPDIILLNIVMPKLDGLEITRVIRRSQSTSHIPIIAVTGLTRPQDMIKLMEAGCDSYLSKPYLLEELEIKIYSCLRCSLV